MRSLAGSCGLLEPSSIMEVGVLFVGDDWAEDHHDVEVQDQDGKVLKRVRLPEGMAGMSRFHELVGRFVPEVRAYYDQLRARDVGHNAALRQVSNRLVGILHGCLKTTSHYNQATASSHHNHNLAA
jgi:hypothetical protein